MQSVSNNRVLGDACRDLREFVRILDLTYDELTFSVVSPLPVPSSKNCFTRFRCSLIPFYVPFSG